MPLNLPFYEEHIWWWRTILNGELIGTGDAEGGISFAELKSYETTIFRYEFMARIAGKYAHGKPWPWVDFDSKFASVSESGEIEHELFDYREFVDSSGRMVSPESPREGWSGNVGFWFKLDAPNKTIIAEIQKLIDHERSKQGVSPRGGGRPKQQTPWHILEMMDQTANKNCREIGFDNDRKGDIPRLVKSMMGKLSAFKLSP